ncbi:MAG: NMT1/THI5 like [Candidatus Electronema aureum]|uniref:NMT1/THI5 like n=1 Tax=Candidatus Electronema aureum TaxID=2005002 RepID=A0A521G157_9BACT|nr:MAG: NMT1/THI5 like [Candidatus Electronema aureum]
MKARLIGALLLLLLGLGVTYGIWLLLPKLLDRKQQTTSDAAQTQGKLRIALDNWIGYFPLRSPEMKSAMHRAGWLLAWEDDKADYRRRMERLEKGELDFAVATVDSYLLNAERFAYPAVIVAVLDESKGGDAILARKDRVASLDDLKGKLDAKVAFTPASPSEHLAKAAADHFNVKELHPASGPLRLAVNGSEQAKNALLSGKADVAVLWEPDVTKALQEKGIVKLLGTEDTERLIVDVLLVRRDFAQKNPDIVKLFLSTYFKVLKKYRQEEGLFIRHIKEETGLAEEPVRIMLKGVDWLSLADNCEQWFGIAAAGGAGEEGLVAAIESAAEILVNAGDFTASPVPDGNPYRLTNKGFLEELFAASGEKASSAGATAFAPLDNAGWDALKEVGTLKIDPIIFQQGTATLDVLGKQTIDTAMARLSHYPHFRIVIKGHTGVRGDADENLRLSQERAEAVSRYLQITHSMDANRVRPLGLGGTKPLAQQPGESLRTYEYRLPRVELVLVREDM